MSSLFFILVLQLDCVQGRPYAEGRQPDNTAMYRPTASSLSSQEQIQNSGPYPHFKLDTNPWS